MYATSCVCLFGYMFSQSRITRQVISMHIHKGYQLILRLLEANTPPPPPCHASFPLSLVSAGAARVLSI